MKVSGTGPRGLSKTKLPLWGYICISFDLLMAGCYITTKACKTGFCCIQKNQVNCIKNDLLGVHCKNSIHALTRLVLDTHTVNFPLFVTGQLRASLSGLGVLSHTGLVKCSWPCGREHSGLGVVGLLNVCFNWFDKIYNSRTLSMQRLHIEFFHSIIPTCGL